MTVLLMEQKTAQATDFIFKAVIDRAETSRLLPDSSTKSRCEQNGEDWLLFICKRVVRQFTCIWDGVKKIVAIKGLHRRHRRTIFATSLPKNINSYGNSCSLFLEQPYCRISNLVRKRHWPSGQNRLEPT